MATSRHRWTSSCHREFDVVVSLASEYWASRRTSCVEAERSGVFNLILRVLKYEEKQLAEINRDRPKSEKMSDEELEAKLMQGLSAQDAKLPRPNSDFQPKKK